MYDASVRVSVCRHVACQMCVSVCVRELQLATKQAQRLEAATAAEERIQTLEQRLASQQDAANAHQAAAAGKPPAMAASGALPCPLDHVVTNDSLAN